MLRLKLTKDAGEFLAKRQLKHQRQIAAKIQTLRDDPAPTDSKALKGYDGYMRSDIGEYRVIYRVDGDTLFVATIGKRNDDEVYRRFKRK
ncbi:MAG: type II toxin-antitoxin system RelE/ParE family toxin [Armatimonadota bacterium]